MKKCKWAGDAADEYCKSCDGIKMMVDGIEKSCNECAGYEEGTEEVGSSFEKDMNPPQEEEIPFEEEKKAPKKPAKSSKTAPKETKITNSTPKEEKLVKSTKNNVEKVSEEKHIEEDTEMTANGIQVMALRYTSSATIKKGDNYFKFTAEEEWSTALYNGDIQDVREQLWAKLNAEVDSQIEELKSM